MKLTTFITLLTAVPFIASAGTVYWTRVAPGSTSLTVAGNWGSGTLIGTDDYVVDDLHGSNGYSFLRSSDTNPFPGKSLTIGSGGELLYDNISNYTVNDFRTRDDGHLRFNEEGDQTWNGTWTVEGSTIIRLEAANDTAATKTIASDMHGVGTLNFTQQDSADGDHVFDLTSAASTWRGSLVLNSTDDTGTYKVDFNNTHDLNTSKMGNLFINSTNGQLVLDQKFTFQNATIGGTSLGQGVYDWDDLDALGLGAYFDGTSGAGGDAFTINVIAVPEPSTFGLLAIGTVMLRRRFRKRS